MKTEYLIKVGNVFFKDMHEWGEGQIVFTPNQKDAKRETDLEKFKDVVAKFELYQIPFHLMKIDTTAEVQIVIPKLVKQTKEKVD